MALLLSGRSGHCSSWACCGSLIHSLALLLFKEWPLAWNPGKRLFVQQLLKLAWPISVQTFIASALTLVDVLMVSQLGQNELAAVGLINRLYFVILIALVGFASGAGILATQFAGRADYQGVGQTLALMARGALLLTAPLVAVLLFWPYQLMQWMSSEPELVALGGEYLQISAISHLFTALVFSYATVARGLGESRLPMMIAVVALLINTLLNALLIFGLGPFPALGVAGAAWSTLMARGIEVLLLITLFYRRFSSLGLRLVQLWQPVPSWLWRRFSTLALPFMAQGMLWAVGVFVYSLIYASMGAGSLAVMSLLAPVESLMIDLFVGLSAAAAVMIGRSLGQERYQAAKLRARFVCGQAPLPAALVALLVVIAVFPLLAATSLSPAALQDARVVLLMYLLLLPVKAYTMLISTAVLRAGGDSRGIIVVDNLCLWLVGLPLAWWLANQWQAPLPAVFCAVIAEELVKSVLFSWRQRQGYWLRSQIKS